MNTKQKEQFDSYIQELKRLQNWYVANGIDGTRNRIRYPQRAFQITNVVIILFSVSIPFISSFKDVSWKDSLLSIFSLLIAALTGLNTFFRWKEQWLRLQQRLTSLVHASSIWELKIADAYHTDDFAEAVKIARDATEEVLNITGEFIKKGEEDSIKDLRGAEYESQPHP